MNSAIFHSPNRGFCICENSKCFVANNDIKGFKIIKTSNDDIYKIIMYSSFAQHIIYEYTNNDIDLDTFISIGNKIITKILEFLRYNNDRLFNIDDIIKEVVSK